MIYQVTKMTRCRCLLLVLLLPVCVHAGPILWTLNNVTAFGDSITGSFLFDADTNTYSSVNITSNGAGTLKADTWIAPAETQVTGPFLGVAPGFVDSTAADETGAFFLGPVLTSAMTDAGGTIAVSYVQAATCFNSNCSLLVTSSYVTGTATGTFSASSVPEPGTGVLLAAGLIGLFAFLRLRPSRESILKSPWIEMNKTI